MLFEARSLKFLEKFICLYHHSRVGLTTRLASLDTLAPKPHLAIFKEGVVADI